jgi:hypothetical protein
MAAGSRSELVPLSRSGLLERGASLRFSLHVLLPLSLGALVYLLWRPTSLRMFVWVRVFSLYTFVAGPRAVALPLLPFIPSWVVYSLPGGLWTYATVAWMAIVWRDDSRPVRFVWLGIAAVIGPLSEQFQLWGILSGVFDKLDLICYSIGGLAALAINTRGASRWIRDSYYLFWGYFLRWCSPPERRKNIQ